MIIHFEIKDSVIKPIGEAVLGAGVAAAGSYLLGTADPVVAGVYVLGMNVLGRLGDEFAVWGGLKMGFQSQEKNGIGAQCLGAVIGGSAALIASRGVSVVAGIAGAVVVGMGLTGAAVCETARLFGRVVSF
jgi:hypothetical protein